MRSAQPASIRPPSRRGHHPLRQVTRKGLHTEYLERRKPAKNEPADLSTELSNSNYHKSLLRIWLNNPWDHYTSAREMSLTGGSSLAYRKGAYFIKAVIRVLPYPKDLQALQRLSDIRHPNVAGIYDLYCHQNTLFAAAEYLELSLTDFDFHTYELEEWEIATILFEVFQASAYLLVEGIFSKHLSMSSIRLSTHGDVKIVLDYDRYDRNGVNDALNVSHPVLELPILAQVVDEMMLPCYHLEGDDASWSGEALDFLSCTLSSSVETLLKHEFFAKARPTSKLAPRVLFTIEVLRGRSNRGD